MLLDLCVSVFKFCKITLCLFTPPGRFEVSRGSEIPVTRDIWILICNCCALYTSCWHSYDAWLLHTCSMFYLQSCFDLICFGGWQVSICRWQWYFLSLLGHFLELCFFLFLGFFLLSFFFMVEKFWTALQPGQSASYFLYDCKPSLVIWLHSGVSKCGTRLPNFQYAHWHNTK